MAIDLLKDLFISKSFCCLGDSLNKCFDCSYCRLLDEKDKKISFDKLPSSVNNVFKKLPVAVNLFYGDPPFTIRQHYKVFKKFREV